MLSITSRGVGSIVDTSELFKKKQKPACMKKLNIIIIIICYTQCASLCV